MEQERCEGNRVRESTPAFALKLLRLCAHTCMQSGDSGNCYDTHRKPQTSSTTNLGGSLALHCIVLERIEKGPVAAAAGVCAVDRTHAEAEIVVVCERGAPEPVPASGVLAFDALEW